MVDRVFTLSLYSTFLTSCLDIAINEGEGYYLGIKLLNPARESLSLCFQGTGRFLVINVTILKAINSPQLGTESGDTLAMYLPLAA